MRNYCERYSQYRKNQQQRPVTTHSQVLIADQPHQGSIRVNSYVDNAFLKNALSDNIYKLHMKQKLVQYYNKPLDEYEIIGQESSINVKSRQSSKDEEIRIIQMGDINVSPQTTMRKIPKLRSNEEIQALTNQFKNRRFSSIRAMISVQRLKRELIAEKQAKNDMKILKQQNRTDLIIYAGKKYNDYTIPRTNFQDQIRKTYDQISKDMHVLDANEDTKYFLSQAAKPDILNVHFPPTFDVPYVKQNSRVSEQESKFFNQITNSVEHMKIIVQFKAMQTRDYWVRSFNDQAMYHATYCYNLFQSISKELKQDESDEDQITSLTNNKITIYLEKCKQAILQDLYYYKSIVQEK